MRYLSKEFYEWHFYGQSSGQCCKEELWRPYEIWAHAEKCVNEKDCEHSKVDSITNLKRAINQRLQLIEKHYNFRSKQAFGKSSKYLEILEELGVVRPFLIKQLFELRNDIEHNDARPPTFDRCKELIDVTWYFLKTTDKLLTNKEDTVSYQSDCSNFFLEITPETKKDWTLNLRGALPESILSPTKINEDDLEIINYEELVRHRPDKLNSQYFQGVISPDNNFVDSFIMDMMIIGGYGPDA